MSANTSQHESTGINKNPTQVSTTQHECDTSQHKSTRVNTSLLEQETIIHYSSSSW